MSDSPVDALMSQMTNVLQGGALPADAQAHLAQVQAAQQNESNAKPNVAVVAPRNEQGQFITLPDQDMSAAAMLRDAELNGPDAILNPEPAPAAPAPAPAPEAPATVRLPDGTEVPADLLVSSWQRYQESLLNPQPLPSAQAPATPTSDVFAQRLAEIESKRQEAEATIANAAILENLGNMAITDPERFRQTVEYYNSIGQPLHTLGRQQTAQPRAQQTQGDDAPLTIGAWKKMQADDARAAADRQAVSDRQAAIKGALDSGLAEFVTGDKSIPSDSAKEFIANAVKLKVVEAANKGQINEHTPPATIKEFMRLAAWNAKQGFVKMRNELFSTTAQAAAPAQAIPRSPVNGTTPMPTAPSPLDFSKKLSPSDLAQAAMAISSGRGLRS